MELADIVAVSGKAGLYKILSRRDDGVIVQGFHENQKKFVSARSSIFTPLENITIYTDDDSTTLKEVFDGMKKNETSNPVVSANAKADALRAYFKVIVPNHDEERVYSSDIKKIIKWYNILDEEGVIKLEEEKPKKEAKEKKSKPAKAKPKAKKETKETEEK